MPNLNLFYTATFFILGSIIGSFLSVVIYRLHKQEKGIITGRSFCPHCKVQLKAYDMIPLISYLFLKGRCRACNEKISSNYFWLELISALGFSLTFLRFNFLNGSSLTELILALVLVSFAIGIAFYDQKFLSVPMPLSIPFVIIGGLGAFFIFGAGWQTLLAGALIGKGFFWSQHFISKGKWVGLGDSDIALGIGITLGWQMLLVSLFISYISASIFGIYLLATKKANGKTKLAFGPFLMAGFFLVLLYGNQILDFYQNFFLV